MPGGQPLRLGPFIGGLNTASDPTAIADAELVTCLNFELDIDGSLVSRSPFKELAGHTGWSERIVCLGEGVFSGDHYLIGSNTNGVYYFLNNAWTLITSTFQASVAVQYADNVYLISKPGSANPGGKWSPSGGFSAVAALPQGQAAVVHKERLFITPGIDSTSNTSRLKFSDSGNFDTWPAANFVDIGQGDGSKLIDITVFQDNLLLFKNHTTYVLAYDVRPSDAVVRKISSTIGVAKQFSVVNYENQIYIIDQTGWVYEIINYDFHRLNTKVPFIRDGTVPLGLTFADEDIFLSLVEDRLICRYLKKIYVYGLRTRTWSEWESASNNLHYFGPIMTIRPESGNEYYSGSCLSENRTIIKFIDKHTGSNKEEAFGITATVNDTYTRSASSSWGTSDSGHAWTNSGGAASDFSVDGSKGKHSVNSIDVQRVSTVATSITDFDYTFTLSTNALATGAAQLMGFTGRYVDASNYYTAYVLFNTNQTITFQLVKVVAGVSTTLDSETAVASLTHAANTDFSVRFQILGTALAAKIWLTSGSQPAAWTVTATDSALTAAGKNGIMSQLTTGNTNGTVIFSYDNLRVINMVLTTSTITCRAKTKNFDMAISHQFKRLWWWGADVTSNNDIIGIATPIVVTFSVTWAAATAYTWAQLSTNTWAHPLTAPSSVETTASTGTGTQRRFAKFQKSLRYRQINFEIRLTTDGSTVDGPARLFTMTIVTESKQAVVKAVS